MALDGSDQKMLIKLNGELIEVLDRIAKALEEQNRQTNLETLNNNAIGGKNDNNSN
jgi:hypothetical protein